MKKKYLLFVIILSAFISRAQVPVYLYFASHNETTDSSFHHLDYGNAADFATMKGYVQQMCDTIIHYNAKYEMMLESNFILGAINNDNAATSANDIIQWANDQPNIVVGPHNHFKPFGTNANPYNYADLVHLLDSCGVDTAEVMGGFIWRNFTTPPVNEDWTQWEVEKAGFAFPYHTWRPTLLWGGGSPNHIDDYDAYGVWRPQAATTTGFGVHDVNQVLVNFGGGCGSDFVLWDTTNATLLAYRIMNFADSVNLHFAGNPSAFFNMKVMTNFRHFPVAGYIAKVGEILRIIEPYHANGKIVYKGIMETYQQWQTLHPNPADYFATECQNTVTLSNAAPDINTSVEDIFSYKNHCTIYPNPSQGVYTFRFNDNLNHTINIYDITGMQLLSVDAAKEEQLNMTTFANGMYFIKVDNSFIQKIIKQD